MKPSILKLTLFIVGFSTFGSGLAFSGAADLSTGDGTTMKFKYRGDKLRINMEEDQGYMIADETGLYVVRDADGQLMVIDAGKMMQMFGSMAGSASPSVAANDVVSLKATGRMEERAPLRSQRVKASKAPPMTRSIMPSIGPWTGCLASRLSLLLLPRVQPCVGDAVRIVDD
ncbi:MAG: hypothetical protein ACI8QT_001857 [Halioglobus sp.]|jgi:hypothetical protein